MNINKERKREEDRGPKEKERKKNYLKEKTCKERSFKIHPSKFSWQRSTL